MTTPIIQFEVLKNKNNLNPKISHLYRTKLEILKKTQKNPIKPKKPNKTQKKPKKPTGLGFF